MQPGWIEHGTLILNKALKQWRNSWGGGRVPPTLLTGKFLQTYREKRGKEKKGKWRNSEGKSNKGSWKIEIRRGGGELQNEERTFFCFVFVLFVLFFVFSLFKTAEISFESTNMGIFYEKAFYTGKKIRKNDFAPYLKYSSYTYSLKPYMIRAKILDKRTYDLANIHVYDNYFLCAKLEENTSTSSKTQSFQVTGYLHFSPGGT